MDLSEALKKCELRLFGDQAIIDCPSSEIANFLWQERSKVVSYFSKVPNVEWVKLAMKGKKLLAAFPVRGDDDMNIVTLPSQAQGSDFAAVVEFVKSSDRPVCVTDHQAHTCLLLNDRFSPERIIWRPSQYMGLNFLHYWRDSMGDLEVLLRELKQNGRLDNFRYRMRRVDGSMAYYVMNYHMAEDYLGGPVRISTSLEWGIIEPAIITSGD